MCRLLSFGMRVIFCQKIKFVVNCIKSVEGMRVMVPYIQSTADNVSLYGGSHPNGLLLYEDGTLNSIFLPGFYLACINFREAIRNQDRKSMLNNIDLPHEE